MIKMRLCADRGGPSRHGRSGLANCGGRRQQMKVCASQVAGKHLPKDQQHGEFNKCMTDPHNYK
jgi:hypothetical protein